MKLGRLGCGDSERRRRAADGLIAKDAVFENEYAGEKISGMVCIDRSLSSVPCAYDGRFYCRLWSSPELALPSISVFFDVVNFVQKGGQLFPEVRLLPLGRG